MLETISAKIAHFFSTRPIRKMKPLVQKINLLADSYSQLSDEALKAKTEAFKERIRQGESTSQLLPEAYAVVKATEVMVGLGEHLTLSARNQFPGKVISVEKGAVNSIVRMEALGGNTISATISNAAVEELGLKQGVDALAVIKATSVMVGTD